MVGCDIFNFWREFFVLDVRKMGVPASIAKDIVPKITAALDGNPTFNCLRGGVDGKTKFDPATCAGMTNKKMASCLFGPKNNPDCTDWIGSLNPKVPCFIDDNVKCDKVVGEDVMPALADLRVGGKALRDKIAPSLENIPGANCLLQGVSPAKCNKDVFKAIWKAIETKANVYPSTIEVIAIIIVSFFAFLVLALLMYRISTHTV